MNRNISRTVFIIFLLPFFVVGTVTVFGSDNFPFVEKHDLDSGSFRGYSTLTIEKTTIQSGQLFSIDVKFFNNSGGDYFYNPFFDRLIPLPAQLAIYDNDKKYLGDLIEFEGGSQRMVGANDWTRISSLCYVGATLNANISNSAPGDYYVQVIFYKSFIAPASTSAQEFYKKFDHAELFRSNSVKIRITK
ncbi:MAG TPA: hypothetical protein VE344_01260 [Methylomirabilota bacterium]|nr:hypothetical protein [Methylomirabilota bacterium]